MGILADMLSIRFKKNAHCFIAATLVFIASALSAASPLLELDGQDNPYYLDLTQEIELKELPFGELLFEYYQENYFSALTRLEVAELRNEISVHGQPVSMIKGVMYLSYGMLNSAESIFIELLKTETQDTVLAQVRFFLAKTQYLNGHPEAAEIHLNNAAKHLSGELLIEAQLIQSQIQFLKGNIDSAVAILKNISFDSKHGQFARFNLAVISLKQGQLEQAQELIEGFRINRSSEDVEKSLKDKINLAFGYFHLERKQFDQAYQYLSQIRLESIVSNRALLALGWIYYESQMHDKAIGLWQELSQRDHRDAAVQEALMAVAFAYYKNGAKKEALESFVTAAASFGTQLNIISQATSQLEGELFANWLNSKGVQGNNVFDKWVAGDVPVTDLPIEYYLQQVVATNKFNEWFKRFQELSHLLLVLDKWSRRLPVFEQMLANHQLRYQTIKPKAQAHLSQVVDQSYFEQMALWNSIISDKLQQDDLMLFATEDEIALGNDFDRISETIKKLELAGIDLEDQKEQLRRVKGSLIWTLGDEYGPRKQKLMVAKEDAENALKNFRLQVEKMQQAESKASGRFANYDQRIIGLKQQIDDLKLAIEQQNQVATFEMKTVLSSHLNKRKQELDFLLAQTELSIAKIQDEAINKLLEKQP